MIDVLCSGSHAATLVLVIATCNLFNRFNVTAGGWANLARRRSPISPRGRGVVLVCGEPGGLKRHAVRSRGLPADAVGGLREVKRALDGPYFVVAIRGKDLGWVARSNPSDRYHAVGGQDGVDVHAAVDADLSAWP